MKAIFIISTLLIFSVIAVLLFTRIPAGANSTKNLSLSNLGNEPTPQPSMDLQEVNRAVTQGPKNTITQGPPRPTKVNPPTPQPTQSGQSEKFTIKSLDNDVIEIGTERHSPPKPYVKLSKWDGEAMLKVHVPFNTGDNPEQIGDKLRYTGDKVKIDFYPKQPEQITQKDSLGNEHKFTINEDGGVEFDTILDEKPAVNYIVFPLETQGLKFYYQPPLNEQPPEEGLTCTATTCTKDGKITDFRPEEVVGSYAVYSDNKRDDYSLMGGKNYKTGKAFHIYRPKIKDNSGQETWGKLNVNESKKTLTLNIDQTWLDNASYPVIIDPIFGYDTPGGTTGTLNAKRLQAQIYIGANGTLTQLSVFSKAEFSPIRVGLYADIFSYPGKLLFGSDQITSSQNTWDNVSTTAVNLSASSNYWLAFFADSTTVNFSYGWDDTSPTPNPLRYVAQNVDTGPMQNPFPGGATSSTTRTLGVYATYTVPPSEFKFNGLKMNGIKLN